MRMRSDTHVSMGRPVRLGVLVTAGVLGLTACNAGAGAPTRTGSGTKAANPSATAQQPSGPITVSISVPKNAKNVAPNTTVKVRVEGGKLTNVALTPKSGSAIPGTITEQEWSASRYLNPATAYTVAVTAQGPDGNEQTTTQAFTTLNPRVEATYRVMFDGQTLGVGMPATITFDSPVGTPEQRAAVERLVSITTTPEQEGAWGWSTNSQLMWRPKSYWQSGTKVTVNAPLSGAQTGDGKWVTKDAAASFTIGRTRISTVDLKKHRMTVTEDGKTVKTYPISAGQATMKYETRSGTKVITEKLSHMVMDAATLGVAKDDPAYYRVEVDYAMRVTNTGEFLHSAPWSVWAQGSRNVSHGCVNMGPRDAKEMFNASLIGDVVDFVGSSRKMRPGEGMDAWLYSWKAWHTRSALGTSQPATGTPAPASTATPSTTASPA